MHSRTIELKASPVFRMALLILGVAVFAWGLQYKMSLYQPSIHPNPVQIAKLMQGEQASRKVTAMQVPARCSEPILESMVPQFVPPVQGGHRRPGETPPPRPLLLVSTSVFLRPPPQTV